MKQRGICIFGCLLTVVLAGCIPGSDPNGGASSSSQSVQSRAPVTSKGPAVSSVAPTRELRCDDGADNDGDQLNDCDDPDCSSSGVCRCGALSCGDPDDRTSLATCRREDGCICNDERGCVSCRQEEQTCETDFDCCLGLNLGCREITKGDGARHKLCVTLPSN